MVPNIGLRCKMWDFDFACIPGIVENAKVETNWTRKINVKPVAHKYYDVHYFFNTLIIPAFVSDFYGRDDDGMPYVPKDVTDFIERVLPMSLRVPPYTTERGRLLLSAEELDCIPNFHYRTPEDIIMHDPFFKKMRVVE